MRKNFSFFNATFYKNISHKQPQSDQCANYIFVYQLVILFSLKTEKSPYLGALQ